MQEETEQGAHKHVVSVDVVCLTIRMRKLCVLLVQRTRPPFTGEYALPGATVRDQERLAATARRVLNERAVLKPGYLEQLYTFDGIADPRGPRMSVAYYMVVPENEAVGSPLRDRVWWPVESLPPLPFDHNLIVHYARHRVATKLAYTPIVFRFLPPTFTLSDLRHVHEAIEDQRYAHPANFQTQMLRRWTLIKTGEFSHRTQKPAQLYRYAGSHDIAGPPESLEAAS